MNIKDNCNSKGKRQEELKKVPRAMLKDVERCGYMCAHVLLCACMEVCMFASVHACVHAWGRRKEGSHKPPPLPLLIVWIIWAPSIAFITGWYS